MQILPYPAPIPPLEEMPLHTPAIQPTTTYAILPVLFGRVWSCQIASVNAWPARFRPQVDNVVTHWKLTTSLTVPIVWVLREVWPKTGTFAPIVGERIQCKVILSKNVSRLMSTSVLWLVLIWHNWGVYSAGPGECSNKTFQLTGGHMQNMMHVLLNKQHSKLLSLQRMYLWHL